jgi:hypothetical protein
LCRGEGVNGFSPSPFPLLLSTSQHRKNQHIHLAVSLSIGRCYDPANKIRWLLLYIAHLRLFTILYILLKLVSCLIQKPKAFFKQH